MRSAAFLEAMDAYNGGKADVALPLMEQCAGLGDPIACYMAALWYKNGDGIPASASRSAYFLELLEQLAERGDAEAQWELAQLYRFGDLLPVNIAEANRWLERAADAGNPDAQHHLAWYLETGQYEYAVDGDNAESWYRRALEQEHPETLYLFAVKQIKDGKPTDEALNLLAKAARKGFKQAAEMLRSFTH